MENLRSRYGQDLAEPQVMSKDYIHAPRVIHTMKDLVQEMLSIENKNKSSKKSGNCETSTLFHYFCSTFIALLS